MFTGMTAARRDLLLCSAVVIALYGLSAFFDFFEFWYRLTHEYEEWELDELATAMALASVGIAWFAYRRWRETRRQLQVRLAINRQLNGEIDAREQAQRTLSESEERLRQATKMARLGYYVWDAVADRCLYCSEEFARMHGVSPEEYIERASSLDGGFTLTHPDDREAVREGMKALRAGEIFEMEYRTISPRGEARYVREIAHPVFDDRNRVVREIGICQDITEMKRAETLLARALDVSPSLFALYDSEDRLVICNQKYRDLYDSENAAAAPGVSFEALVRGFARRTGITGSEAATEEWVRKRLDRRRDPAQGYEYQRGDGEWIEVTDHLLEDGSLFTVASVITERKRVEAELLQSQKMEAVGRLTGGVAHDFNNLLGVILGNAELLEDELGSDNAAIQAIFRAGQRGAELTQRLLAFSRRQPLRPSTLDLAQLVDGLRQLLGRTLGDSIEVVSRIEPAVWPVKADAGQLENALLNLALNARDAMPHGGKLCIAVRNAPGCRNADLDDMADGPRDCVSVQVVDTGTGMSAETLAHAFEPFFTTKEVGQGSGLGLSMVYGLAKQSGGDVQIESEPGRGTTVTLYLPRVDEGDGQAG